MGSEPTSNWKATHNTLGEAARIMIVCIVIILISLATVPWRWVRGHDDEVLTMPYRLLRGGWPARCRPRGRHETADDEAGT
jgi:hypothetical protein